MPSPPWVTGLMFGLFGVGFLGHLPQLHNVDPPRFGRRGQRDGGWSEVSGCILAGIITATQVAMNSS